LVRAVLDLILARGVPIAPKQVGWADCGSFHDARISFTSSQGATAQEQAFV